MSLTRQQLAHVISCHAWSPSQRELAVCPNSKDVLIYAVTGGDTAWQKAHMLVGHDNLVTGLDWSAAQGKLVSCSQDRSIVVWQYDTDLLQWTRQRVNLLMTADR